MHQDEQKIELKSVFCGKDTAQSNLAWREIYCEVMIQIIYIYKITNIYFSCCCTAIDLG